MSQQSQFVVKVFYTWGEVSLARKYDPGFGKEIEWDVPLLDGYDFYFPINKAKDPGSHHFGGINNPNLIDELAEWRPDAILVFGWNFNSHLRILYHFKGRIPVFFRGDSTLLDERPGIKKILRRIFLSWVYRHVDYAFYVGTNNKNYFIAHRLKEEQLIYAPHAIDNNQFMDDSVKKKQKAMEWRRKLGIKDTHIVFLFAGKFENVKNPIMLINAIKIINDTKTHLIFVGNGELENKMKESSKGYCNIHFIEFQNQQAMTIIYRLADVFVYPSISETWGLAVNEAMASGLPVIVSDKVGCSVDLVTNGSNGCIFESNNINSLTEKLRLLSDNLNRLKAMGANSKIIIAEYSMEKLKNIITASFLEKSN